MAAEYSSEITIDAGNSARFVLPGTRAYNRQFTGIYRARYAALAPVVMRRAKQLWRDSGAVALDKVVDARPGVRCFFVGTVFREMLMRPSYLDELALEYALAEPPPMREKLTADTDRIMIEDDHGRALTVPRKGLDSSLLVTGVVVAFLGSEGDCGAFEFDDICYAELPKATEREEVLNSASAKADANKIPPVLAVVSGLRLGSEDCDVAASSLMFDFVAGNLELPLEPKLFDDSPIAQFILLGNNFDSLSGVRELDRLMAEASDRVGVCLVPGPLDMAPLVLPQQPVHSHLFPISKEYITSLPNPMSLVVNGLEILAISGQSLDDAMRYIPNDDRVTVAEMFLRWRHLCPTAPDTIGCYPFEGTDPFVITTRPRVFLVGNQPKFEKRLLKDENGPDILIVLVPKFNENQTAILLNPESLECQPIVFGQNEELALAGGEPFEMEICN